MLVLLIASLSPIGADMLLRADAMLLSHWSLSMELLSVASLTEESPSFVGIAYERESLSFSSFSTCSLHSGLLLCISILLWYGTDEALEYIEDSLELLMLEEADLSLRMSISISISMLEEL